MLHFDLKLHHSRKSGCRDNNISLNFLNNIRQKCLPPHLIFNLKLMLPSTRISTAESRSKFSTFFRKFSKFKF